MLLLHVLTKLLVTGMAETRSQQPLELSRKFSISSGRLYIECRGFDTEYQV